MRLIDADALKKEMYHEAFETNFNQMVMWDSGLWIRYKMFENKIKEAPTIEERKKGKWIEHDDFDNSWECSSCNEVIDIIEGTPMDNEYRFCPWCGAEMEGGAE